MNVAGLYKLIDKLVLREYKWIVAFEIDSSYDRPWETYTIIYYTDSLDMTHIEEKVWDEIKDVTEDLFKVLGPERFEIFEGVDFRYDKRKLNN
jgi:hypothetical protein